MKMMKGLIRNTAAAMAVLWTLAAALSSCKDDLSAQGGLQGGGEEDMVTINFAVSDAAMPGTRADGTPAAYEEQFTEDLWVLVFKEDKQHPEQGNPKRYYMARRVTESKTTEGMYTIEVPIDIFQQDLTFLFVANASSVWNTGGKTQHPDDVFVETPPQTSYDRGVTLDQCLKKLLVMKLDKEKMNTDHHGILQQFSTGLPMFCIKMWSGLGDGNYPSDLPMQMGKVELLRAATRIDVGLNYADVTGQDGSTPASAQGVDHFKMVNVYAANTRDAVAVSPFGLPGTEYAEYAHMQINSTSGNASSANPWTIHQVSVPEGTEQTTSRIYAYDDTEETPQNAIEQRLYVPEQENKGNLTTDIDPGTFATARPYLIIKGYYGADNIAKLENPDTKDQAKPSYYRLDFIDTASGTENTLFDLKRGSLVRMNITDVLGPGYDTPDEAANSLSQNMKVETTVWDIMNSNVAFDGQSFISAERMNVDMPRDAEVSFRLLMDKSTDIDWSKDVTLGYEAQSTTGESTPTFPEAQEEAISIPGLDGSTTAPLFTATKSTESGKTYVTITTKKKYSASEQPAYLLVKAKRITLKITLTQKDISTADWERGNNQNLDLDGSPVSSRFIYFPGGGDEQGLIVKPSTTETTKIEFTTMASDTVNGTVPEDHKATWVSLDGKQGDIGTDKDMVSVTLVAQPNTTDDSRVCYGILTYGMPGTTTPTGRAEEESSTKKAVITISQTALTRADVSSLSYGFKWRDRTSGTLANSLEEQLKSSPYTYEEAKLSCPYGWGLPDAEDFTSLKGTSDTNAFDGGISFAKVDENAAMLYTTYTRQYLKTGSYWTQDGKYVTFSMGEEKKVGDQLEWNDVNFQVSSGTGSTSEKHYARCIRKFRLNQKEATLNMAGEAVYVDYITLNTSDDFDKITVASPNTTDVKVERDGTNNRIKITAGKANWSTTQDQTYTVTLKMKDGSDESKNLQTLKVTQLKRPGATTADNYITINGIDWDFQNLGATDSESKYYYVYMGSNNYPYKQWGANVQPVYTDKVFDGEGNIASILTSQMTGNTNPSNRSDYYSHFGKTYGISGNDPCETNKGNGWRLPSLSEWKELFERLHVYEETFKVSVVNAVKNNETTYPIYYITDGKTITFIPMGVAYLNNGSASLQNSHTFYGTSDAYRGSNRYAIGINRLIYKYNTEEKVKYDWASFIDNFDEAPPYTLIQRTVSGGIEVPVRCVRASQTKAK